MNRTLSFALAVALVAAAPASSWAALQNENILAGLPAGFTLGNQGRNAQMAIQEFVPAGETVDNWTRIFTEQIFYSLGKYDPDAFAQAMSKRFASDCPAGTSQRIARTVENGYAVSVWSFLCPNNAATGKPENMWMKVVGGQDALYSVQYAYRQPLSDDMAPSAMSLLKKVLVCDTRIPERPCPAGL